MQCIVVLFQFCVTLPYFHQSDFTAKLTDELDIDCRYFANHFNENHVGIMRSCELLKLCQILKF